jgi:hypothetical protein
MAESIDPLTPVYADCGRRRSSSVLPQSASGNLNHAATSSRPLTLSPPLSGRAPRSSRPKLSLRLRSNSGLSLHTNEDALRQYIDYNPDGSPRTLQFGPVLWHQDGMNRIDAVATDYRKSMGLSDTSSTASLSIQGFFGREVFQLVLNNPATSRRLWKFAQASGNGENVEYLMKVSRPP